MDKLSLKQKQLFGILISVVFHLFLVLFCLIKPVTYEFVAVESRAFHCIMLGVVLLSLILSIILTKRINTFSMLIPIIAFQAFEIYYTIAFSRKLYEDNTSNILSFIFRQNITWVIAIVFSVILGVIILLSAIPKTAILKIIASVLIVAFSILKIFVQLIYRIIHFYGIKYVFREFFLFVPFVMVAAILVFRGIGAIKERKAEKQQYILQKYPPAPQRQPVAQQPIQRPAPKPQPASVQKDDPTVILRKYKALLDDGVITQEDFDKKKAELLNL